jgi:undecaprenyl-diphosphatase
MRSGVRAVKQSGAWQGGRQPRASVAAAGTASRYGVIVVGLLFGALLAMVLFGWSALDAADRVAVNSFNGLVSEAKWIQTTLTVLTNFGGSGVAWTALTVAALWLAIRREWALAIYVMITGLGSAILTTGVKEIVERARPAVEKPVAVSSGFSFPSGHSLGSTVAYGVLLLVFLPIIPRRLRGRVIVAVATVVVAIGVSRIALGVHYPSDVLGGWLLGGWWLLITAMAFRRWHSSVGLGKPALIEGLEPEDRPDLLPAPANDRPLPGGWHTVTNLLVAGVLIWGVVVGAGLLIAQQLPAVRRWDATVADWFADLRSEGLTDVLLTVSRIGDTSSIIAVLLVAAALSFALSNRWRPTLLLVVAVIGEVLLFGAAAAVVGRGRPAVEHLSPGLPATSSFPSGHVAATTALYGAIALLIVAWTRRRLRYAAILLAFLLALAVGVARMYMGVHFISDVATSVAYSSAWVAVCFWLLRPTPAEDLSRERESSVAAASHVGPTQRCAEIRR